MVEENQPLAEGGCGATEFPRRQEAEGKSRLPLCCAYCSLERPSLSFTQSDAEYISNGCVLSNGEKERNYLNHDKSGVICYLHDVEPSVKKR